MSWACMGFGNLGFAADTHPPLSTVHVDGVAIGRQAARFIIDRLAGRDTGPGARHRLFHPRARQRLTVVRLTAAGVSATLPMLALT